jgi:CheY-like chemotaxis protein
VAYSILLADDSQHAQRDGSRILSELGYEVVTVSNGSAALQQLEDRPFDLVIADTSMPGLTGLEVCQRIRERPEWTSLPVLLALAAFELYDAGEGRRAGADDVIQKPFIPSALERAVQTLLAKSGKVAVPTAAEDATVKTNAAAEGAASVLDVREEVRDDRPPAPAEESASAASEPMSAAPRTEPAWEVQTDFGAGESAPRVESPAPTPGEVVSAGRMDPAAQPVTLEAAAASPIPAVDASDQPPHALSAAGEPVRPRWEVEALEVVSEDDVTPMPATPPLAAAAVAGPLLSASADPAPGSWLATLAELKTAVESAPQAAPPVPKSPAAAEPEDVLLSAWREAMAAVPNSRAQVDLAAALNAVDEVLAQYLAPMIAGEASDQIGRRLRALSH